MKPRVKGTANNSDTFLEVTSEETSPIKKSTSTLCAGESVQCEMGSEVFRRYWTPPNEGMEGHETGQVITGDPIESEPVRYITLEEGGDYHAASTVDQPNVEPGDKVDANSCSSWSTVFPSHGITLEKGSAEGTASCKEGQSIVLSKNGADTGTVVFPLVLNVVDESGTKEVVAVVSLDPMPPSNLTEHGEVLTENSDENAHVLNKALTCGDCGQVFSSIVPYEKHCFEHNITEPFKCTRCSRRFKRRQDLDRHRVCHPEEAFPCTTCFAKFSDREELIHHYKTHAPASLSPKPSEEPEAISMLCKIETFQCSQCDKSFNDADLLQHHEFTHSEGELYPCDQCGRTFREESRLGMHLKLHKKNQRCDKCNEVFTNMFDFNEHMIAHKHEDLKEDYKCLHCKVSFNSFYFLKKHASSHGMEVHWCGDCGGSGHVGLSHDQAVVADASSACEIQVLGESVSRAEEDPLKLDCASADMVVVHLGEEEDDEAEVKHEISTYSEEESEAFQSTSVTDKTGRGKRKLSQPHSKALQQPAQKHSQKYPRNN